MANNKITLGNETLIDLTEDTVTEDTLLEGNTAHDASGNIIIGRAIAGASNWDDLSGKPFESIDNTTLVSNEGVLSAVTPDQYIEAVSSEFTVSNKTLNLSYATEQKIAEIDNKADSATTLSGYGITDSYTKTETNGLLDNKIDEPATEGTNGQALVTDGNGGRSWQTVTTPQYIESVTDDFTVTNKKLALSNSITTKLSSIDSNGKVSADNIKSGTNAKSNAELTKELSIGQEVNLVSNFASGVTAPTYEHSYCYYIKIGKLVIVNMAMLSNANTSKMTYIVNGLPKCAHRVNITLPNGVYVGIDGTGTSIWAYSFTNASFTNACFELTYICEE